jgi:hypothetical protein
LTLEKASSRLRSHNIRIDDRIDIATLFGAAPYTSSAVLASVNTHYAALPTHFKSFATPTGERDCDIFGFQAANIQATMLLLRMLFLRADDDCQNVPDVQLKCNVAAELLAVFQTIPTAYLRGISTPLIYHLAGIGTILGSVMESPLSEAGYQKVKGMLLSIANLLERLESGLSRTADISKGLRTQVERIEEYMRNQLRPVSKPNVHVQPEQAQEANSRTASVTQQQQHTDTVRGSDVIGIPHLLGMESFDTGAQEGLFPEWLDEFQLPPELLEHWPWPFNQQPESWPFMGFD